MGEVVLRPIVLGRRSVRPGCAVFPVLAVRLRHVQRRGPVRGRPRLLGRLRLPARRELCPLQPPRHMRARLWAAVHDPRRVRQARLRRVRQSRRCPRWRVPHLRLRRPLWHGCGLQRAVPVLHQPDVPRAVLPQLHDGLHVPGALPPLHRRRVWHVVSRRGTRRRRTPGHRLRGAAVPNPLHSLIKCVAIPLRRTAVRCSSHFQYHRPQLSRLPWAVRLMRLSTVLWRASDCVTSGGVCPHLLRRAGCRTCTPAAFCQHGRLLRQCKECGGGAFCAHGERRGACAGCVGASLCPHGSVRSRCLLCGVTGTPFRQPRRHRVCEHGIRRSQCADCGGKGTCPHGRHRSQCHLGCGTTFCHHGRVRYACKPCGGLGICLHGKHKKSCRFCSQRFCEHGKRRYMCIDCVGRGVCEHGMQRRRCLYCGGQDMCAHGMQTSQCATCRASTTHKRCPHGLKDAYYCVKCHGGGICPHQRIRSYCTRCRDAKLHAGSVFCEHNRQRRLCVQCVGLRVCAPTAPRTVATVATVVAPRVVRCVANNHELSLASESPP